jgi:hypothetical protein
VLRSSFVRGDKLSVDGTFVEANASKESRIPREQLAEAAQVNRTVREWLTELEAQNPVEEPTHSQDQVSTTDPDSTYATKGGTPARMGYYNNYLVDNDSCIIVGVQATGARLSEESRAAEEMITQFTLAATALKSYRPSRRCCRRARSLQGCHDDHQGPES